MARKTDRNARILDAALTLAAERGWNAVSMSDIAAAAEVAPAQLYAAYPTKTAILSALIARTDEAVLRDGSGGSEGDSRRDRLFDLLMRRLEVLAPHKEGIRAMLADVPRDPVSTLAAAPPLLRAMTWMLDAAGVPADGLSGLLRAQVLAGVYLATLRTWSRDDSPDMARTMAALDRNLRRAGRLLGI